MVTFAIREASFEDRGFAYDAWWKQMADLRPVQTPMGIWRRGCQENVGRVLRTSNVLVVAPEHDPDDVVGVVCFSPDPNLLHFVYTKFHVRRWGLASRLLERAINGTRPESIRFTTMPRKRFMGIVDPAWRFDPFAGTRLHFGTGPFQETPP